MTDRLLNDEMDCRDFAAVLSAVIDDQLEPRDRHLADRHLAVCKVCTAMYDEAERINDSLVTSIDVIDDLPAG